MKIKKFTNICLMCVLTFVLFGVSKAQQGTLQLSNGITIAIKTVTTPSDNSQNSYGNIYSSSTGNIIHRVVTDRKNKIYFGYDLLVERQDETEKFKVSIKPLSKEPNSLIGPERVSVGTNQIRAAVAEASKSSNASGVNGAARETPTMNRPNFEGYTAKSLPNYPDDILVDDGDTITLDLLENSRTNTKISDVIKIIYKSSKFDFQITDDKPAKDFTIEEVMLRIEKPDIYINEKKYKTGSTAAGNINWIYIYRKGRFIFSFEMQPGYNFQKIGVIQDNKISFEFNGDKYEFVSKSPILGSGGKWNLWVMHDPDFQPVYKMSEENPFIFGAAGKMDYLFQKR